MVQCRCIVSLNVPCAGRARHLRESADFTEGLASYPVTLTVHLVSTIQLYTWLKRLLHTSMPLLDARCWSYAQQLEQPGQAQHGTDAVMVCRLLLLPLTYRIQMGLSHLSTRIMLVVHHASHIAANDKHPMRAVLQAIVAES